MKNTAKLIHSSSFTRGAAHNFCTLCDGGYEKWTYVYARVTDGPAGNAVICPECLKARNFSERAEEAAKLYEKRGFSENAEALRAATAWDVPSFEEWETANNAADDEYVKDCYPEAWTKIQAEKLEQMPADCEMSISTTVNRHDGGADYMRPKVSPEMRKYEFECATESLASFARNILDSWNDDETFKQREARSKKEMESQPFPF